MLKAFFKEKYDNGDIEIDVNDYIDDFSEFNDGDEIYQELLDNNIFGEVGEIIYYGSAMEYLAKHDPSLQYSLEIADEYGYEMQKLNSEILASLHNTQRLEQDFRDIIPEIDDVFETLQTGSDQ